MGRVGEVIIRTWQTAAKMKIQRGSLPEDNKGNDNFRCKRYIAKYTINPAIAHGISNKVGSLQENKLADIVIWEPAFFGVKPEKIIKGGAINYSLMGDPNASIPTPQPVHYRPMFGQFGRALFDTSITFVSQISKDNSIQDQLGLNKLIEPVIGTRNISKDSMLLNNYTPVIQVDSETYEVRADGVLLTCEPAEVLPMAQRYFLY